MTASASKRVAVLGATGRTGQECLRILRKHPELEVAHAFRSRTGQPGLPAEVAGTPDIEPLELQRLDAVDGVLVCAPHGASAALDFESLERDCKVVDLSADYRLSDPLQHAEVYGPLSTDTSRSAQLETLRKRATYGLTEFARDEVASAQLVANPGCYPTAVSLALKPLAEASLIDTSAPIHADCKSGVSGAGNTPSALNLFSNVHENFQAYKIGEHRHEPEMRQATGLTRLHFVPHLLPVDRGILATLWFTAKEGVDLHAVQETLRARYDAETFVTVCDEAPCLRSVQWTNHCHLQVTKLGNDHKDDQFVVVAVLDNLVKGAAGQAIQNMNLMLGLEEGAGLS